MYDICVKTGDAGDDATGRFSNDNLLPDIWAGPYLRLEPDLAFVLEDHGRPVGYVLGTADTASFVKRYRAEWLPVVSGHYREPLQPPATPEASLVRILFNPEIMLVPELEPYPAHLHIDILAEYRHGGAGRRLIETFSRRALHKGAGGVHVVVSTSNNNALAFYRAIGFREVGTDDSGTATYMAMQLQAPTR